MTTSSQLRKTALANPEVVEGVANGASVFAVGGNEFASLDSDAHVRVRLPIAEAEDMVSQHATAERVGDFVRLPIKDINGQALNYWVRRAWHWCTPPELAARASAAEKVGASEVGDLPKAIGRPATQGLANAGITRLDQVAELSDSELKALHGVGPKAVSILREALDAR